MKHLAAMLLATGVFGLASSAQAGAFPTCGDAYQYGANSGSLYVGQVFARMACDPSRLARSHDTLARVLGTQVLRTSDDDATKLCYYGGLYHGVVTRLALEYARCGACAGFECLDRLALADEAGGVLRALSLALADPYAFDAATALATFPGFGFGATPWCEPAPNAACVDVLASRAGAAATALYGELFEDIATNLCGSPPDAEPDAGASEPDAGAADAGADVDAGADAAL